MVHACQTWIMTKRQMDKINSAYCKMIRKITKGGFKRNINSWSFVHRNEDLLRMAKTISLESYVNKQQRNYLAHIIRKENSSIIKKLLFEDNSSKKQGPQPTLLSRVIKNENCSEDMFYQNAMERKF